MTHVDTPSSDCSVGAVGVDINKGKKMPGHMGAVNRKARNLTVVQVRGDRQPIIDRGLGAPGPNGGVVIIRKALKK